MSPVTSLPEFIDERQLSERIGIECTTLQNWRWSGKGPRYVKVGRLVRYNLADVLAWLAANTVGTEQE